MTKELVAVVAPSERVVARGRVGHTLLDHHHHQDLEHLLAMTPHGRVVAPGRARKMCAVLFRPPNNHMARPVCQSTMFYAKFLRCVKGTKFKKMGLPMFVKHFKALF